MPKVVPRPQPVRAVLADRRITVKALAQSVGVNPHSLGRIVNGYNEPWPALRRRIAETLELPEAALFRDFQATAASLGIDTDIPEAR